MKSLKESLFDSDLATKKLTFGDLFEVVENENHWKDEMIEKQFSALRIKKKTGVSSSSKEEIIYKGFIKIIQDIELKGKPEDLNKQWLSYQVEDAVWDFFQYSMKRKNVYVQLTSKDGHLILDRDKSILDNSIDAIQIFLGAGLKLVFRRK